MAFVFSVRAENALENLNEFATERSYFLLRIRLSPELFISQSLIMHISTPIFVEQLIGASLWCPCLKDMKIGKYRIIHTNMNKLFK